MDKQQLEQDFENIVPLVIKNFQNDHHLVPAVLVRLPNGKTDVVALQFKTHEGKIQSIQNVVDTYKNKNIESYIFISEAWTKTLHDTQEDRQAFQSLSKGEITTRQFPDAKEKIVIFGEDKYGNSVLQEIDIHDGMIIKINDRTINADYNSNMFKGILKTPTMIETDNLIVDINGMVQQK